MIKKNIQLSNNNNLNNYKNIDFITSKYHNTNTDTDINYIPSNNNNINDATGIYSVFHLIISIIAIYLSFRCNTNINYGSILIAVFCPYIYIIYSIIINNGICELA